MGHLVGHVEEEDVFGEACVGGDVETAVAGLVKGPEGVVGGDEELHLLGVRHGFKVGGESIIGGALLLSVLLPFFQ